MATTTEGRIQKDCIDYLTKKGIFHIRINTQGQFDTKRAIYRKSTTMLGTADLLVIAQGQPCFVEVKAPKGKLSVDQVLFRSHCEAHCIEYEVVRSLDDLIGLGFKR